ncbi:hypothetical protein [Helicobacter labetoulli]|uniref:hypothetical protein n=1 Tax=Helicobacter labetoulli TaxID=2315333 RepID=UPI001300B639|nr:hypothetical protein [Helicobacter labetoulli]
MRFYFIRLRSCLKRKSTHESLESRFLILKAFLDFTILRGIVNNSSLFLSLCVESCNFLNAVIKAFMVLAFLAHH